MLLEHSPYGGDIVFVGEVDRYAELASQCWIAFGIDAWMPTFDVSPILFAASAVLIAFGRDEDIASVDFVLLYELLDREIGLSTC